MSGYLFDKEIKLSVVKLIVKEDFSIKEFNIHTNILYRWIQEYVKYGDRVFPCRGSALFDI